MEVLCLLMLTLLEHVGRGTVTTAWLCEGGVGTIFKANCKTDLDATLVKALLIAQYFDLEDDGFGS